jgi:serine/threonine protein kinase
MLYFSALPIKVKKILSKYFENKPFGTKIKCGQSIAVDATHNYVLKNSYIKLEKDVYAIAKGKGAVIGHGVFGKVKRVRSLSTGKDFVMKIIPFVPSDKMFDAIENEVLVVYDLGLYRDAGSRNNAVESKQYIVMVDAGTSLNKYIRTHPELNTSARFDLAIKLCWLVYSLHQGISSRTLTPYAHRDLKPANAALDSARVMRLIDLGLATDKLDTLPSVFAGAPGYLPNRMTFTEGDIVLRQMDILALKRMIYMPNRMLCFEGYIEDKTGRHFGIDMILSEEVLKKFKLFNYFDTSAKGPKQSILEPHQYNSDPIILACLLVLARYNLLDIYGEKMRNPILACVVLGVYFSHQNCSDELVKDNIAKAIVAYVLQRVAPRYKHLAEQARLVALFVSQGITNHLQDAVKNETLISLFKVSKKIILRSAALLWQNGFYKEAFYTQLHDNEELARKIIKLIFDGDLPGVEKIVAPLDRSVVVKPAVRPLALPSIYRTPQTVFTDKSQSSRLRVGGPSKVEKSEESKASRKPREKPIPLFFALPNVKRIESTLNDQAKAQRKL